MEFSNGTTSIAATTASNGTASSHAAPHRKNAAQRNRSDSPYQQRTSQKDNPTQLIIKQAVDFLIQQLEAGKSETLTAYLGAMARFHNYSFGNIVAIARQRPTATRVAGFGTWKEMGRFVKRGEKGIQILAPMIGYRRKKDDAEQNTRRQRQASAHAYRFPRRVCVRCGADRRRRPAGVRAQHHRRSGRAARPADCISSHSRTSRLNSTRRSPRRWASATAARSPCFPASRRPRNSPLWFTKRRMNFYTRPSAAP